MKLDAYLRASGLSLSAFAQQVGLSEAAISRYLSGKRTPRADAIRRIVRATRGRVQPEDLLPVLSAQDGGPPPPKRRDPDLHEPDPPAGAATAGTSRTGRSRADGAGLEGIDLILPDLMAVERGKRVPARDLPGIRARGIRLPESMFSLDAMGRNVFGTGIVMESGDEDRPVLPVDGQLIPAPWSDGRRAVMLMTMRQEDGSPHFADPRTALTRVVDRLAADRLAASCAVELEFYLLSPDRDGAGRPRPAGLPRAVAESAAGEEALSTQIQVAALQRLDAFDPVLSEIARGCDAMDMVVESLCAEYAPGQFEVNLRYVTDPLRAADEAVLFRHLVRQTARRHGLQATFMSKPFAALSGSGMHVHANLVDGRGRNLFARGDARANRPLLQAIAGAAETMAEGMAIFAATANAFRRFGPGSYAPVSAGWGIDNRTVALRIPGGPARARRIEHRVAGAEANPYLVVAAVLAGIHHGIEARLEPPPQSRGDVADGRPAQDGAPVLPTDWPSALAAHDAARILPDYLGRDFWRLYGHVRRAEMVRAQAMIPDTDYQLYLDGM